MQQQLSFDAGYRCSHIKDNANSGKWVIVVVVVVE